MWQVLPCGHRSLEGPLGDTLLEPWGWGLSPAAGYQGPCGPGVQSLRQGTAPHGAGTRPGPRARKEVGNEHTQNIGQGKEGEGETEAKTRLLGGTGTRVGS